MTNERLEAAVATGVSYGAIAKNDHAKLAVERAVAKLGNRPVAGILLFLTAAFAHRPEDAIRAAAKAAGTTQVTGCCANGVFTEEARVINAEGAAAMAFTQEVWLNPFILATQAQKKVPLALCLSSPNAAHIAAKAIDRPQFGVVASDEFGDGPFSIWQSGQVSSQEHIHAAFPPDCEPKIIIGGGIKPLSPLLEIQESSPYSIQLVDGETAVDNLYKYCGDRILDSARNLQNIYVGITNNNAPNGIRLGQHQTSSIVAIDRDRGFISLSRELEPAKGQHLFWGIRDSQYIRQTMQKQVVQLINHSGREPRYGLLFNNLSRGAALGDEIDFDRELLLNNYNDLPLIGCYGNAEVAPSPNGTTEQYNHSSVCALIY